MSLSCFTILNTQTRPSTPVGNTERYPILPLTVICKSDSEAEELLSASVFSASKNLTAVKIVWGLQAVKILDQKAPFYPVVMGMKPAIYREW
jgi:hypothetical protein